MTHSTPITELAEFYSGLTLKEKLALVPEFDPTGCDVETLQRLINALTRLKTSLTIAPLGNAPDRRLTEVERRKDFLTRRNGGDIRSGRDRRFRHAGHTVI